MNLQYRLPRTRGRGVSSSESHACAPHRPRDLGHTRERLAGPTGFLAPQSLQRQTTGTKEAGERADFSSWHPPRVHNALQRRVGRILVARVLGGEFHRRSYGRSPREHRGGNATHLASWGVLTSLRSRLADAATFQRLYRPLPAQGQQQRRSRSWSTCGSQAPGAAQRPSG